MRALLASEVRQRLRSRKWWVLVALWTIALFLIMIPIRLGGQRNREFFYGKAADYDLGPLMFGSLALLVLGLSCLVIPSLTAMAINGERDRGTLAVLQATLLRPHDIVIAKFLSGLLTASIFLIATLPIAAWCYLEGSVSLVRLAAVYLVLLVVAGVLIALALVASALVRRPALSAVLSYGFVALLTIGTGIIYGIAEINAQEPARVAPIEEPDPGVRWLWLAPNPFVVLADAAPRSRVDLDDPLASIQEGIRHLRNPEPVIYYEEPPSRFQNPRRLIQPPEPEETAPVWSYGLMIELGIAAAAIYVTMRRLRVPVRRLAPGHRVA